MTRRRSAVERALPGARIVHDARLVERRAEHRGVGDLAAEPAADAALVHVGHRVVAQRVADCPSSVSDGQPLKRMHDLSPVQTSGSTPKRGASTRAPALSRAAVCGFTRRWRSSWHSRARDDHLEPARGGGHGLLAPS